MFDLKYLKDQLINFTMTNVNQKVLYTANTGTGLLSTANSNLDGTGTIVTVLTASSNGTLIKKITVKAQGTTTKGMVRLFVIDGGNFTRIIEEVKIPARIQSSIQTTFRITYEVSWYLKAGYALGASTEKAENFIVIAEGLDYSYPTNLNGI